MTDAASAHGQRAHAVRLEWGPVGAASVAGGADVAVVVDVLSFTTTLSVAVGRGVVVLPYRWAADDAPAFAARHDARLAVGRRAARPGEVSLSPSTAIDADPGLRRVVLPSPNGSTIALGLGDAGCRVVGASLRNASAVAGWLAPQVADGAVVAVVAAGERWPDGSLRPAVEDLWGAGAVLAALASTTGGATSGWSPETTAAAAAWSAVAHPDPGAALRASASGRELVDAGFADDVRLAAQVDADDVVPLLDGGEFTPA